MTYNISQHLNVLTPAKGSKTKFHCPACNGHNLDIKTSTGVYSCFNGCTPKDIRAAIDQLEGKPEWKSEQDDWVKSIRPKSQTEYFYPDRDGNLLIKVVRIDPGDGSKKTFPQFHWTGSRWEAGNPQAIRHLISIYRYREVRAAIGRGELIFWVEGEATADLLWKLGIAATTTIGGSGAYSDYGNYQADLAGARIVPTPDRDRNGLKYIANIDRDLPAQIEGYYLAGTQGLWRNPQGGMDIGDDICDYQLTKEQILAKVISTQAYSQITTVDNQSTNLSTVDLRQKLTDLVNTRLERSDIKIRLTELAKDHKTSVSALESIIKEIEVEADRDERRSELKNEVERLTAARSTGANIHQILPPSLAEPIASLAKSLGHNCEPYMLYLLAGTGGVLHSESFIRLRTGYEQPGNLYGGVVAVSGSLKSPVQKQMLTKPLSKLQKTYNEQYKEDFAKYELENESWKPDCGEPKPIAPHHHVVYTNSMTMEAMDIIAAKQPEQSAIYIKDELKAIFLTANQYRKGDDVQAYLSRYDGEQLSRIRSGAGFFNSDHDVKFTMMGTIQPEVLSKLAGSQDDDDGLMSRFLFSNLECEFVPMTEEGGVDVVDLIAGIYNKVHNLPATTYKLNPAAFKKFAIEFDRMRLKSLDQSLKGWERNVWSKAGGQLGRLMLNLHLIWSVSDSDITLENCQQCQQTLENGSSVSVDMSTNVSTNMSTIPKLSTKLSTDADLIQPQTVERAIELIRYFVDQAIGIIAAQSPELSPQLARILDLARSKGPVTPRVVIHSINGKNKPKNTKQALDLLQELTAMGYGALVQNGRSFIFTANVDNVDNLLTNMSTNQNHESKGFEAIVDNVDIFSHIPKQETSVDIVESNNTTKKNNPPPQTLLKGDRVKNKHTGEEGFITNWAMNRTKATIQFDNGDLSGWLLQSDLVLLERG
jgi:Protein of unknown function (DUF3987)